MRILAATTGEQVDFNQEPTLGLRDINEHTGMLEELALRTFNHTDAPKVADFGCGPGQSSLNIVRPVLDAWSNENPKKQLSACFADLPGNDWGSLRATVLGKDGLIHEDRGPQVEMLAGNFYNQMLCSGSVALATAFNATHWLRHQVFMPSPKALWFSELPSRQYQALRQVAKDDFALFVSKRMEELMPGGCLVVSTMGAAQDTSARNGIIPSKNAVIAMSTEVMHDMVSDGLLQQHHVENFLFPIWFLTEEDARDAILQNEVLAEACEIDHLAVTSRSREESDPKAYLLDQPELYARHKVEADRAVLENTLEAQLFNRCAASARDAHRLSDEFFSRLEDAIRQDVLAGPYRRHVDRKRILTMVLRKRKSGLS
ncbi:hypothetical protein [Roseibium sp. MMSF_3544]|uniref:hypothetical protein n=1 Tax=unclassified Roseibium TaxID=2629323 RepID=UPI00273F1665|nr:hypothetical protein [Roseibium sp. MMSF_3544]